MLNHFLGFTAVIADHSYPCYIESATSERSRLANVNMLAELGHSILLSVTALQATILVILLRIGSSIPYVKERIKKFEERKLLVPYQNFWDEYAGSKMLAGVLKIMLGDVNKTARLGDLAPNCRLVSTDGKECRLLDFAKGTRPLVLNFGSCT